MRPPANDWSSWKVCESSLAISILSERLPPPLRGDSIRSGLGGGGWSLLFQTCGTSMKIGWTKIMGRWSPISGRIRAPGTVPGPVWTKCSRILLPALNYRLGFFTICISRASHRQKVDTTFHFWRNWWNTSALELLWRQSFPMSNLSSCFCRNQIWSEFHSTTNVVPLLVERNSSEIYWRRTRVSLCVCVTSHMCFPFPASLPPRRWCRFQASRPRKMSESSKVVKQVTWHVVPKFKDVSTCCTKHLPVFLRPVAPPPPCV